jgi:hypothetical protein
MLRKNDLLLIVQTGHTTGIRDVGHFDHGNGFVGPQKLAYSRVAKNVKKERKKTALKRVTVVHMGEIHAIKDSATGRVNYSKR